MRGDIREAADCARIVDAALERHGRVDTLLNNAGGRYLAAAEVVTPKGWAAVQRLNIDGTLQMTEACVQRAGKRTAFSAVALALGRFATESLASTPPS